MEGGKARQGQARREWNGMAPSSSPSSLLSWLGLHLFPRQARKPASQQASKLKARGTNKSNKNPFCAYDMITCTELLLLLLSLLLLLMKLLACLPAALLLP